MKKLQASYHGDVRTLEQAKQKNNKRNIKFFIDLATIPLVAEDTMPMEDGPQLVKNTWNHPILESQRNY